MGSFSLDLPVHVPLQPGSFRAVLLGVEVVFEHSVVQQEHLDQRLGGISGSFGFQEDPLGVLRYSRLRFTLDAAAQSLFERAIFGDRLKARSVGDHERRVQIALAVCNQFLDRYRVSTRLSVVHPLGRNDLAFLRYEDGNSFGDVRLYGGNISNPLSGLSPLRLAAFVSELAEDRQPEAHDLAILNAARSAATGSPNEAIVTAVGSLETALDTYFARSWRMRNPKNGTTCGSEGSWCDVKAPRHPR